MTNRRAKIAAGMTVLGLGALGGIALGSNPGPPVATQQAGRGSGAAIVTSASGAAAVPTTQTVPVKSETHQPIVTRASGGGVGLTPTDD